MGQISGLRFSDSEKKNITIEFQRLELEICLRVSAIMVNSEVKSSVLDQ
jgi:hypothetical protein